MHKYTVSMQPHDAAAVSAADPPAAEPGGTPPPAPPPAPSLPITVGVLGGTGYTGRELLRLLASYPAGRLEVAFATTRSGAGEPTVVPGLRFTRPDPERAREADVLFLCVPLGQGAEWVRRIGAGPRIIDLTADHRPGSGREAGAVYGLAELARDRVRGARLVANPGCYPTGVILSLLPLREAGLVDVRRLATVSAASGVTGAGRKARTDLLFAEVAGNFRAYGAGNRHRHLREMNALLDGVPLHFQPHLLPVDRGILETLVVPVAEGVGPDDVRAAWRRRYAGCGAVRVLDAGLPELRDVVGTDLLHLGVSDVEGIEPPVVTVVAALDNLGKGAAGQAVQNMNSMMGWPLDEGIRCGP
jgi:N-acetyl-gamma-glutamyl-phosphate reductase